MVVISSYLSSAILYLSVDRRLSPNQIISDETIDIFFSALLGPVLRFCV